MFDKNEKSYIRRMKTFKRFKKFKKKGSKILTFDPLNYLNLFV